MPMLNRAVMAALIVALVGACGPDALTRHIQAAQVVTRVAQEAGDQRDRARMDALHRVADEHRNDTFEVIEAAVRAEAERWAASGLALDAINAALREWTTGLWMAYVAQSGDSVWPTLIEMGARTLTLYQALAASMVPLGVTVPVIPDSVMVFVRAAGGQ